MGFSTLTSFPPAGSKGFALPRMPRFTALLLPPPRPLFPRALFAPRIDCGGVAVAVDMVNLMIVRVYNVQFKTVYCLNAMIGNDHL